MSTVFAAGVLVGMILPTSFNLLLILGISLYNSQLPHFVLPKNPTLTTHSTWSWPWTYLPWSKKDQITQKELWELIGKIKTMLKNLKSN